jgi:ATP-dependent helicase/nuclease subunit A
MKRNGEITVDAHAAQRRAAAPGVSAWVSASAGTGKTKVLTDRLLGLMLEGSDPARVLCLTFTRAAAAEMANRLNERLAAWATLPEEAFVAELLELTGHEPDDVMTGQARQLFARVLDSPGGVKIATIHAFCQALLRRFPLEADVSPEFAVLDERGAREALLDAAERVIVAAREGKRGGGLAEALAVVAGHVAEERFGMLMSALAGERGRLRAALDGGYAALRDRLCTALSLAGEASPEGVIAAFCAAGAGDEAGLRAAATALAAGSPTDRERGEIISEWCAAPEQRHQMLEPYTGVYLTDEGETRKTLITRGAAAVAACDACVVLSVEAERVKEFREAQAAAVLVEATCALTRLGEALIAAYDERKRTQGVLDYEDLVTKALDLLRRPGVAPWVLFKLDGGLDHILIDEAQDTNPDQWEIVAALAEEFFAGEGAADRTRTIFAVGDAKQSIYSFQRADPHAFLRMRRHFETRIAAAGQEWHAVPLEISYRSTEPVLRAIDAIFRREEAHEGVALDGSEIRHLASRVGQAGLVELWPPVAPQPDETPDPMALPVTRSRFAEPRTRLADAVAATVRSWLDRGEVLEARGRSIRPGDIMVLVRRRNEFVGELLRALKQRDVPVAGADRLILTEQLAVQDLVALGRFLLFPDDDLTLAAVLKGPLFALDEETLFDLAYARGRERLWDRLRGRASTNGALRRASERLSALLARADFVPPYELYAEILGAEGGRRALLERLGPEAEDPVEEFLALTLAYEREHAPSLQGFLRWLVAGDTEVKRDFGARPRDEVRILTVHGAKGLEAPIVFLPDTMQLPKPPETLLWTEREALPLWRPRAEFTVPIYTAEREAVRRRELQEYRRLLYVGLSRAQDRLYVCGWQTRIPPKDTCWHGLCRAGLTEVATPFEFDATALIGRNGWSGEGLRLAGAQTASPILEGPTETAPPRGSLPSWVRRPPPPEPDPPKPLFPSRTSEAEPPVLSPLGVGGHDRFKRGLLVHRLLQGLPELPAEQHEEAARRFLALPAHSLRAEEQDELRRETLAVLRQPEFAAIFGPGSQAEVPLVGLVEGHVLSGQIDRLLVEGNRVLVVDFKTLRSPPATEADVAPLYLRQLALYRAALARIYPGHEIRCALLWTEGPRLMPISPERLAGRPP